MSSVPLVIKRARTKSRGDSYGSIASSSKQEDCDALWDNYYAIEESRLSGMDLAHEFVCILMVKLLLLGGVFGMILSFSIRALASIADASTSSQGPPRSPGERAPCVGYFVYQALLSGPAVLTFALEVLANVITSTRCVWYVSRCSCIRVTRLLSLIGAIMAASLNALGFVFYWTHFNEHECHEYPVLLA